MEYDLPAAEAEIYAERLENALMRTGFFPCARRGQHLSAPIPAFQLFSTGSGLERPSAQPHT